MLNLSAQSNFHMCVMRKSRAQIEQRPNKGAGNCLDMCSCILYKSNMYTFVSLIYPRMSVIIQLHFQASSLSSGRSDSPSDRNFIGELGELAAKKRWPLPQYDYPEVTGEPHSRTFTCLVKVV
jgi:hypothetical protein